METSTYQNLKLQFIEIARVSKDAVHMHIGLAVFTATVLLWKKGKVTPACLIPVLFVAFGMEAIDLYDDYYSVGYMRWSNSIHDIINTLFWPVFVIILLKIRHATRTNL